MAATSLADRIKAEFEARDQRRRSAEANRAKESQGREARLQQFTRACDELKSVWRPKLEEFARQFGEKIKITPSVTPQFREAKAVFLTDLATMNLSISVAPDEEVTKLVVDYDLLIIPIFFEYERHARFETPLGKIDRAALEAWFDDRLLSCVRAYLTMQDNENYVKRAMVEDPISRKKLLREDAAVTLEHQGQKYFFESQDTMKQYKAKLGIQ